MPNKFHIAWIILFSFCLPAFSGLASEKKAEPPAATKATVKESKTFKLQLHCPFIKREITKDLYVDYEGMRIYTCCVGCVQQVKWYPKKAIANLMKWNERPISHKELLAKGETLGKMNFATPSNNSD